MDRETIHEDELAEATITIGGAEVHAVGPDEEAVCATLTLLTGFEAGRLIIVPRSGGLLGRADSADFRFSEPSVSRAHATIGFADGAFTIEDLGSQNGTFVDGKLVRGTHRLPVHCRIGLGGNTMLQFAALDELGSMAIEHLSQALLLDPLTGTGNRYHLENRLRAELSFARRHVQPFGVLLLDLDHFKQVNDRHGHQIGDVVLRTLGQTLLRTVRAEDAVFRFGGEEFCILVRGVDEVGLVAMGDRLRREIAKIRIPVEDGELTITASIGVATLRHGHQETEETIVLRADQAMYQAKAKGRDRVVLSGPGIRPDIGHSGIATIDDED